MGKIQVLQKSKILNLLEFLLELGRNNSIIKFSLQHHIILHFEYSLSTEKITFPNIVIEYCSSSISKGSFPWYLSKFKKLLIVV